MKSPSAMSMELRRKKKLMDKPDTDDAVDLSGIPDDATDQANRQHAEYTTDMGMDTNKPKMRPEDAVSHQALMADARDRQDHTESDQEMPLEHYAMGGATGRGAIAGGPVPKHTMLAKVNGFAEGGEVEELDKDSQSPEYIDKTEAGQEEPDAEALLRRKARIAKMLSK